MPPDDRLAGMVRGQRIECEERAELVEQRPQVPCPRFDVGFRIQRVGDAVALRGDRHQLHQAHGAGDGNHAGAVAGLHLDHRVHETRVDAVTFRGPPHQTRVRPFRRRRRRVRRPGRPRPLRRFDARPRGVRGGTGRHRRRQRRGLRCRNLPRIEEDGRIDDPERRQRRPSFDREIDDRRKPRARVVPPSVGDEGNRQPADRQHQGRTAERRHSFQLHVSRVSVRASPAGSPRRGRSAGDAAGAADG